MSAHAEQQICEATQRWEPMLTRLGLLFPLLPLLQFYAEEIFLSWLIF